MRIERAEAPPVGRRLLVAGFAAAGGLVLLITAMLTIRFIFAARRRRAPLALVLAGTGDIVCGSLALGLATGSFNRDRRTCRHQSSRHARGPDIYAAVLLVVVAWDGGGRSWIRVRDVRQATDGAASARLAAGILGDTLAAGCECAADPVEWIRDVSLRLRAREPCLARCREGPLRHDALAARRVMPGSAQWMRVAVGRTRPCSGSKPFSRQW